MTKNALILTSLFAAAFMLLPLPVMQYIGEESWYALSAYEMYVNGSWWNQPLLGMETSRTPLFNWLVIAVAQIIGWEHLPAAPRLISVLATWGGAVVLFFMSKRIYPGHSYTPWLAATIFLTMGEVFFWYGWLGYSDNTFGIFTFAAIAALWVAIEDENMKWFMLSLLLISLAFMTKNMTCYAAFGSSMLILLHRKKRWHLLKQPLFLLPGLIAACLPFLFQHFALPATTSNIGQVLWRVVYNFTGFGLLDYLKHWISYPLLFLARAFPVTLLLLWFYWRDKQRYQIDANLWTLILILLAALAPYWLSAGGTPRYLVPFYGLLALIVMGLVVQLNSVQLKLVFKTLVIIICLKVPFSLLALPYLKDWRPERDISAVAEDILQITESKTIRSRNDISTGLSIAAYIDVQVPAEQYVRWYDGKERQVYILAEAEDAELGELIKSYRIQGQPAYLYWQP